MKSLTEKTVVLALFSIISMSCLASNQAKLFGKAHLSFGTVSEDDGITDTSSTAVDSHASRIGVKGAVDTDSDTTVIYRFVWQIDMTDNAASSDDHIKSREQYVGLKGEWGQLRIGRDDSPYKKAGKKNVEQFSDSYADYNNIIDKNQDTRNDNSVGYWLEFGPAKFGLQYAAGDDEVSAENAGQSYNVAYDMKTGSFGFAVAYQAIEKSETNDETGTKLILGYKQGATQLGVIGETVEDDINLDDTNMLISIKHNISNKNAVKFVYGTKDQGNTDDATMTAFAFDHNLGNKVSIYALWADGADGGLSAASKLAGDSSAIALGVVANF